MRYNRVLQIANLDFHSKRANSNNLRVYFTKGIAAAVHTGGGWKCPLLMIIRDEQDFSQQNGADARQLQDPDI